MEDEGILKKHAPKKAILKTEAEIQQIIQQPNTIIIEQAKVKKPLTEKQIERNKKNGERFKANNKAQKQNESATTPTEAPPTAEPETTDYRKKLLEIEKKYAEEEKEKLKLLNIIKEREQKDKEIEDAKQHAELTLKEKNETIKKNEEEQESIKKKREYDLLVAKRRQHALQQNIQTEEYNQLLRKKSKSLY
jgi:hypothetical protein